MNVVVPAASLFRNTHQHVALATADPDIDTVVHAFAEDDLEMQKALV